MEGLGNGFVQLELKYCERCGALWLRLRGSDVVFCDACARAVAGLLPRLVVAGRPARAVHEPEKETFWAEGGNA